MASNPGVSSRLKKVLTSDRLYCYDAYQELNVIREWYEMIEKTVIVESESMKKLEDEAKDNTAKLSDNHMEKCLKRAIELNKSKSVSGLWRAENVVVLMYTDDGDKNAFFLKFNSAMREKKWKQYLIYTALLVSAVQKLAKIYPIPKNQPLFRGLDSKLNPPESKRIFWKTFTSTSLSKDIAKKVFAGVNGMVFELKPSASNQTSSRWAAQIKELSHHPEEEEVLLLPFEAFDVIIPGQEPFYLKTSEKQDFLA